jgi:hypothetical protein
MATSRNRKPSGKAAKKASRKPAAKSAVARSKASKSAKVAKKAAAKTHVKTAKVSSKVKPAKKRTSGSGNTARTAKGAGSKDVKRGTRQSAHDNATKASAATASRPASVKSAARALAAARAGAAAKRRPPSYIPRSRLGDDWMLGGPVELPRQPKPAAHAPTRKPPKPRAPKPKAISHEQAVANLKALLEGRKRKDRGGASASKGA